MYTPYLAPRLDARVPADVSGAPAPILLASHPRRHGRTTPILDVVLAAACASPREPLPSSTSSQLRLSHLRVHLHPNMQGHRGPKPQEQRRPRIVWIPVASASARPAEGYDNEDYPCRGRSLCLPAGRLCPASSALTPDFSVSASASGHATRIASAVGRVALSTLSQHPWRTATLAWRFMCVCLVERAPHLSPSTPSSILPHHATQYAVEDETQVVALKRLSRHHGSNVMTIWRSSLWADPSGHLLAGNHVALILGVLRFLIWVWDQTAMTLYSLCGSSTLLQHWRWSRACRAWWFSSAHGPRLA